MRNKQTKLKKTTGKTISSKLHLWLGLASGLVVFIVSITGCLYVFEEEIRNYTQKEYRYVQPQPNIAFASVLKVEETIKANFPTEKIKQIRTYGDNNKAWQVQLEKDKIAAVNPYTATIIHVYSKKDWLNTVESIHKSLLLGNVGKWIIRINVLIFLVLLITGIVLWWPGNKARRKQSFKVKWDASGKRVNYDFHNVFGFYSSLILLLIVLTGMYMSFDWMKRATYFATGSPYQKPKPAKINPDLFQQNQINPGIVYHTLQNDFSGARETHINYPQQKEDLIKIRFIYASSTYRKADEILVHPYTAEIISSSLYKNYSLGDKVKHSNRDLHTGAFFGLFGKILAFLASLIAASMPVTGFAIWWGRRKKTVKKKLNQPIQNKMQPVFMNSPALHIQEI